MDDFRKAAALKTLREEYGIHSALELLEAICTMEKLDITQFTFPLEKGEGYAGPRYENSGAA